MFDCRYFFRRLTKQEHFCKINRLIAYLAYEFRAKWKMFCRIQIRTKKLPRRLGILIHSQIYPTTWQLIISINNEKYKPPGSASLFIVKYIKVHKDRENVKNNKTMLSILLFTRKHDLMISVSKRHLNFFLKKLLSFFILITFSTLSSVVSSAISTSNIPKLTYTKRVF